MAQENMTDNDLVQQIIFNGGSLNTSVETEKTPEVPENPEIPSTPEVPQTPVQPTNEKPENIETPETPVSTDLNIDSFKDEQVLELINKKFNVKFDTAEDAKDFFSNQVSYRGQEKIITQLVQKVKENANVLSHYPSENSYKVAKLSNDFPGKEVALSKIVSSDVDNMDDFEAIRLAEELKRKPGSKVSDPLGIRLSKMGLRDLDISDFEDWDERDKELVYGEAEDAKAELLALKNKYSVPSESEQPEGLEFISELERGVQQENARVQKLMDEATPIAQSLVNGLLTINPVEGSDFKYDVKLDNESKSELVDFLVSETVNGNYDLRSDAAVATLNKMLIQEIWATDGAKIAEAYANARVEQAREEADKKYENWVPLNEEQRRSKPNEQTADDNDAARRILGV